MAVGQRFVPVREMRRLKSYFHGIQSKCCEEKCRSGAEQIDGGLLNCQQVALYPSYRPCCCECRECEPMNCGALLFLWLQLPAPVPVTCVCNLRGRRLKASSLSPHLDMEVAGHVVGTPVCDKCLLTNANLWILPSCPVALCYRGCNSVASFTVSSS